ncbi:hypothetical protein BDR26DRAFT_871674 [Obelidium mucronatum]|nr:hypothetical protein BDR26DRAFT_871674 [Obelidium mucronatum]
MAQTQTQTLLHQRTLYSYGAIAHSLELLVASIPHLRLRPTAAHAAAAWLAEGAAEGGVEGTNTSTNTLTADALFCGHAAKALAAASHAGESRARVGLAALLRIAHCLAQLRVLRTKTTDADLDDAAPRAYEPIQAPAGPSLTLAFIQSSYTHSDAFKDALHAVKVAENCLLSHIVPCVVAAVNLTLELGIESLAQMDTSTVELAALIEPSQPVADSLVTFSPAFEKVFSGVDVLARLKMAVDLKNPDYFLQPTYIEARLDLREEFRNFPDKRPDRYFKALPGYDAIREFILRQINSGVFFEFQEFKSFCNAEGTGTLFAVSLNKSHSNPVVLLGEAQVRLEKGVAYAVYFTYDVAASFPVDLGWESVTKTNPTT